MIAEPSMVNGNVLSSRGLIQVVRFWTGLPCSQGHSSLTKTRQSNGVMEAVTQSKTGQSTRQALYGKALDAGKID
jgi:hypothetical protein